MPNLLAHMHMLTEMKGCGTNGKCGFEPENCGLGNCTSNCNAHAMCGRRSATGKEPCGMNLCCSWSGWCGYKVRSSSV